MRPLTDTCINNLVAASDLINAYVVFYPFDRPSTEVSPPSQYIVEQSTNNIVQIAVRYTDTRTYIPIHLFVAKLYSYQTDFAYVDLTFHPTIFAHYGSTITLDQPTIARIVYAYPTFKSL